MDFHLFHPHVSRQVSEGKSDITIPAPRSSSCSSAVLEVGLGLQTSFLKSWSWSFLLGLHLGLDGLGISNPD